MFCLYVDDLLCVLAKSKVGCYVCTHFLGALGYADDIVILAPTASAVRTHCDMYVAHYEIVFNAGKSRFMRFAPKYCSIVGLQGRSRCFTSITTLLSMWINGLTFPFGRICFVMLVMRKGGESSWSGPWHLGCTSEVFHVHSYQDQFIQPGWAECVLFSLGLYFVCLYCFNLFVCRHPFVFPWAVESSPLQVLALA